MAKKGSVPNRQHKVYKKEYKFIDMPKEKFIKEVIILVAVIVVIVAGILIWRANDGHLPVKDGVVVTGGDNWLVTNTGTSSDPRYFKLGEAGEVEGYTQEKDPSLVGDANVAPVSYKPEAEDSKIRSAYVMTGNGKYDASAANLSTNFKAYIPGVEVGEVQDAEFNGTKAKTVEVHYSVETPAQTNEAGEEVAAHTDYYAMAYAYLQAGHDHCIVVQTSSEGAEESALATMEELKAETAKLASAVKVG